MKTKSIQDLLKKLEEGKIQNSANISNLNDNASLKVLAGGYVTNNHICVGSQPSCSNDICKPTGNDYCYNGSCG